MITAQRLRWLRPGSQVVVTSDNGDNQATIYGVKFDGTAYYVYANGLGVVTFEYASIDALVDARFTQGAYYREEL